MILQTGFLRLSRLEIMALRELTFYLSMEAPSGGLYRVS